MSKYIPSTETVRRAYIYETPVETPAGWDEAANEAEFDRWIAQHDAEVAKATEERIIKLLESLKGTCDNDCDECRPHAERSAHYLTALQDLIKGENK